MNELTVQKLKDMPDAELIGKGIGTFSRNTRKGN